MRDWQVSQLSLIDGLDRGGILPGFSAIGDLLLDAFVAYFDTLTPYVQKIDWPRNARQDLVVDPARSVAGGEIRKAGPRR